MKLTAAVAVFTAAAAFAAGYGTANIDRGRASSADRTAYSFIHAINHGNQGRACSWGSQEWRAARCPPAGTWRIVGRTVNPDGSVRYTARSPDAWADATLTVVKHANGKWRVNRIG